MSRQFVEFFRQSAPYIHAHRGKTAVVLLVGQALEREQLEHLVADLALLSALGLKLVLVQGTRAQLDKSLIEQGITAPLHQNLRITTPEILALAMQVNGQLRHQLEAAFSRGLMNSPMFKAQVRLVSGNFVAAQPLGVLDGQDMLHTGRVRTLAADNIRQLLDQGQLVLVSHLGYSVTGEIFNLRAEEVAVATAKAIGADKLVIVGELPDKSELGQAEFSENELAALMQHYPSHRPGWHELQAALEACQQGVPRCHLVSQEDGSLLAELYTRDGIGLMVSPKQFDQLRQATLQDVTGILELLAPLEAEGVLVARPRESIEQEIAHFIVLERDGFVIGCAALYDYPEAQAVELACLVVHPDYRGAGRAERLLKAVQQRMEHMSQQALFVLTTQTAHWFAENGFVEVSVAELPASRQQRYNRQRNSKVFVKYLGA